MTDKPNQPPLAEFALPDPARVASNMARVMELSAEIARGVAERGDSLGREASTQMLPAEQISKTLGAIMHAHLGNPQKLMEAQGKLWSQYTQVWNNAWLRMIGQQAEPLVTPGKSDKRFKDKDWADNVFYDALKQFYLLTSNWSQEMVRTAEGVDEHTRQKARFYVENILNAFAPTNHPLTNPEVLKATLASSGANLVRGMQKLVDDLQTPDGRWRIKQVDSTPFKLGETIATTPGKVVFRNELFELIQYSPQVARTYEIPLLIVPPWINKYYILDLNAKKSFVKYCVENGLTVFIMSWANADEALGKKTFQDYMQDGVLEAIAAVRMATGASKVHTTGFCIGGTLLATTLGYLAGKGEDCVASSTFFTTQVDFEKAGDLLVYVDEEQVDWIEDRMRRKGYLPGSRMADAFNLLRSNDLIWSFVVNNYLLGKDPMPFDLLHWNSDSTSMPFGVHSYYLRECYVHNSLSRGHITFGDVPIDLKQVRVPIYNLACREDHIAPLPSVFRMSQFIGSDVTTVISGSGHIAGVINPPDAKKYQYWTNSAPQEDLQSWMASATEHPGSWWPHWLEWITAKSGEKQAALIPGDHGLEVLCDAPGENVKKSGLY